MAANTASVANVRLLRVSKELSLLLRHKPPPGLMDASGWIAVAGLLPHLKSKPTYEEIKAVVENNDKKRFVLDEETQPPRIRAAQGHSVQLVDPILAPVSSAEQVPLALHVTSSEGWAAIRASGALRRMARTHIHFATSAAHMRGNSWATVVLQLDLAAALQAGHAFFLSDNQVLLCEGPLAVELVRQVQLAELPEDWQADLAASRRQPKRQRGGGRAGGVGRVEAGRGDQRQKEQRHGALASASAPKPADA